MVEIMVNCLNIMHQEFSNTFITYDVHQEVKNVHGDTFTSNMQPLGRQHAAEDAMNNVGKWCWSFYGRFRYVRDGSRTWN